jgi:hypothetical protein
VRFPVCPSEADDAYGVIALGDDGDMQTLFQQPEDAEALLAVFSPPVLDHERGCPINIGQTLEGTAALCDIALVFGGVEDNLHCVYLLQQNYHSQEYSQ